jgi:hypothetical protein
MLRHYAKHPVSGIEFYFCHAVFREKDSLRMDFKMKKQSFSARMVLSSVMLAGTVAPVMMATASAAPRPLNKLEIWPGQRVVMILPITTGESFEGGPELGRAIVPIVQQYLQNALAKTGKFSVVTPYRFDPILRRAVFEKTLTDEDVDNLLKSPGLVAEEGTTISPALLSARNVLGKIKFDQPAMILETRIEELVVGGTAKSPTVQLQVSGQLHEIGNPDLPKTVVVRSRSFGGATPEIRLQSAAAQAFQEMAERLIEPPASFQLPLPALSTPAPVTKPRPVVPPVVAQPVPPVVVPPSNVTVKEPSPLSPAVGQPFVPQLPPSQPPLNIAVGEVGTQ